jgi:uncharacterized tellurite resistance protein B-like protein
MMCKTTTMSMYPNYGRLWLAADEHRAKHAVRDIEAQTKSSTHNPGECTRALMNLSKNTGRSPVAMVERFMVAQQPYANSTVWKYACTAHRRLCEEYEAQKNKIKESNQQKSIYKGSPAMNPNAASYLSKGAYTVGVTLLTDNAPEKVFKFVTDLPMELGDIVIVERSAQMHLGVVKRIDDTLNIDPTDTVKYTWVIAKADLAYYEETQERLSKLTAVLAAAHRETMKVSYANALLASLSPETREEVLQLTGGAA